MTGWLIGLGVVLYAVVAVWVIAWLRSDMDEAIGRDLRRYLIAQAKAEEDGRDARPAP